MANFNVGTPLYMAPECLKSNIYSAKTDLWSLGILYYELLHGKVPFLADNEKEIYNLIIH